MERKNFDQSRNIFGIEIIEIFLFYKETSRKVMIKVNKFDQLGVVKQKIKNKLQIEGSNINLLTKGKILKGDHKILKDFKIEARQVHLPSP
jgi:hypothetical protein